MQTVEIETHLEGCRNILVGKLPLLTDQIELIAVTLVYKMMDDIDDASARRGAKRALFAGELAPYRWRQIMNQKSTPDDRVALFSAGIVAMGDEKKAAHLPPFFRDVFKNMLLKFRDAQTFTSFCDEINAIACQPGDELGEAFAHLIQQIGVKGDSNLFATPQYISDFMTTCLNPKVGENILDPMCGTGGLLVTACKHILNRNTSHSDKKRGDKLTGAQREKIFSDLHGFDNSDLMVKLGRVNFFVHGMPVPDIKPCNILLDDEIWYDRSDVVIGNPPFIGPRGTVIVHDRYRAQTQKTDVLFTEFISEHLTPDGRACVVVPHGFTVNVQNIFTNLRRYLVENSLVAVVSLPANAFTPYSPIRTTVLFLDKKLTRHLDKVLFVKVNKVGIPPSVRLHNAKPEPNDIPEVTKLVAAWLAQRDGTAFDEALFNSEATGQAWHTITRRELLRKYDINLSTERFSAVHNQSSYERVQLETVCEIGVGATPARAEDGTPPEGETIKWISSRDINDDHTVGEGEQIAYDAEKKIPACVVPPKSLLLVSRLGVGKWATNDEPVSISQDITAISAKDPRLLPDYLQCLAPVLAKRIDECAVGSTVRGVGRGFITRLEIPLPPLDIQESTIKKVLGHRQIVNGARQILDSYNEAFDVFAADAEPVSLGECADFDVGYFTHANETGDTRYVRMNDLDEFGHLLAGTGDERYVALTKESQRYLAKRGDIYISRVGVLAGKVFLYDEDVPGVFASYLIRAEFNEKMLPKYFWYYSRTKDYWTQRTQYLSGGEQPQLTSHSLRRIKIPLPSIEEQRQIVEKLDAEMQRMEVVAQIATDHEEKIVQIAAGL